jgi:PEGA domain/Anaphase-promoting complex subunit 4 WD40 domain/WD40-like Beta Propeller Repeat
MIVPTRRKTGQCPGQLLCCLVTVMLFTLGGCKPWSTRPVQVSPVASTPTSVSDGKTGGGSGLILEILTTPPASISVDSQPTGMAPVQFNVPAGSHLVRIELDGYETQVKKVMLSEDTPVYRLSVALPIKLPQKWTLPQECVLEALSPDNVWVVIYCEKQGPTASQPPGVWVGKMDGTDWNLLASADEIAPFSSPSVLWSPDGTMLVLSHIRGPVKLIRRGKWGDKQVLHTKNMGLQGDPVWSPDSRHMAVTGLEPGTALALLSPDGVTRVLLHEAEVEQPPNLNLGPTWSPDGQRLAYLALPDEGAPTSRQLWVMDISSGKPQRLFETDKPFLEPVWSPDGHLIALLLPWNQIFVFDLEAGKLAQVPLPKEATEVHQHVWAPDSDRLALETQTGLWIVSVTSGKTKQVTSKRASIIRWSGDGQEIIARIWEDEGEAVELIPAD